MSDPNSLPNFGVRLGALPELGPTQEVPTELLLRPFLAAWRVFTAKNGLWVVVVVFFCLGAGNDLAGGRETDQAYASVKATPCAHALPRESVAHGVTNCKKFYKC